jgi:DNA-binding LacI/PurR family transcriptional regulator
MAATIKDIAKEAGVSISAVSKALNNKGGISLEIKRKIERIAESLGYSPFIKSRQTGMYASPLKYVAVMFPAADEFLSKEIQRGIDSVLSDSGYLQIRHNLNEPSEKFDELRKEIFVDTILQDKAIVGLISVFIPLTDSTVAKLEKNGLAAVQLNQYSSYGNNVVIDNVDAAYGAVKALIESGRKKIGLIMPKETVESVWADRLGGYKKALAEAGMEYNPYWTVHEHLFSPKESALAARTLLNREPGIDAILFGSDIQAYGGLEALRELGKVVPGDVAVMGFDDLPFSGLTNPPLSSVSQPMFEMGKTGAQLLFDVLKKRSTGHKSVALRSRIVLRRST